MALQRKNNEKEIRGRIFDILDYEVSYVKLKDPSRKMEETDPELASFLMKESDSRSLFDLLRIMDSSEVMYDDISTTCGISFDVFDSDPKMILIVSVLESSRTINPFCFVCCDSMKRGMDNIKKFYPSCKKKDIIVYGYFTKSCDGEMQITIKDDRDKNFASFTISKEEGILEDSMENCYVDDIDEDRQGKLKYDIYLDHIMDLKNISNETLLEEVERRMEMRNS